MELVAIILVALFIVWVMAFAFNIGHNLFEDNSEQCA